MATIAEYPTETTLGVDVLTVIDQPIDFQFERFVFEDGAAAVNVQPCGLQRWELYYDGLTDAERQILLDHYNAAQQSVNDFQFTHPRTALVYTGVKYQSLTTPKHVKQWSLGLHIVLFKVL